jgi:arginine deiminase
MTQTERVRPADAYGVHSEVGKLRKVLVCSPGSRATVQLTGDSLTA